MAIIFTDFYLGRLREYIIPPTLGPPKDGGLVGTAVEGLIVK